MHHLKSSQQWRRIAPVVCFHLMILLALASGNAWADIDPHFKPLAARLVRSGFNQTWINSLFSQPCVTLKHKVLLLRLTIRESKINYAQFYQPKPIRQCRQFMDRHNKALQNAQAKHSVPAEVITAILLLETRLGGHTGSFITLPTLATHAVAGDPQVAALAHNMLPAKEKRRWSKTAARKRLGNRAAWSYGELKAFLKYIERTGANPCSIKGSYTGAIGLCQFQPSNLKPYGRDGNGDGIVNLFQVEDAITSAAAYLQAHGWRETMSDAKMVRVLKTYNNSTRYANTIMEVARRLRP